MGIAGALYFAHGDLQQKLQAHHARLVAEIEAASESYVVETDVAVWAKFLVDTYAVHVPLLKPDEAWSEELEPAQVTLADDRPRLFRGPPRCVPGHRTVVRVPFSGDAGIFHVLPSSFVMDRVRARVGDNELFLDIEYPDVQPLNLRDYTVACVERIELGLEPARTDVARFNSLLESQATKSILDRRGRIKRHRAHLEQTGLPTRPQA